MRFPAALPAERDQEAKKVKRDKKKKQGAEDLAPASPSQVSALQGAKGQGVHPKPLPRAT